MDKVSAHLNKPTDPNREDYADKGLDSLEKKVGGGKVDPAKARPVNEKITDKARGLVEKATGKHVPDKVSN